MSRITFSQVLKNSVERETTSKGWCSRCQRYQTIATRKTVHSIPAVLMLNTAITNQEHRMLWSTPGWLPEEIGIIVEQGQFFCYEGEDLKLHLQRGIHNITVYSLIGMAINIESGQTQKPHLVSMVNGNVPHVSGPICSANSTKWLIVSKKPQDVANGTCSMTFWCAQSLRKKLSPSTRLGNFRQSWRSRSRKPTTRLIQLGRISLIPPYYIKIKSTCQEFLQVPPL